MSGYGIDDVPTLALNDAQRENLLSEDNTQAVLMAEAVIQVSENDQAIGPISKLDSHSGAGEYHRAFSVLLFTFKQRTLTPTAVDGKSDLSRRVGQFMLLSSTPQRRRT